MLIITGSRKWLTGNSYVRLSQLGHCSFTSTCSAVIDCCVDLVSNSQQKIVFSEGTMCFVLSMRVYRYQVVRMVQEAASIGLLYKDPDSSSINCNLDNHSVSVGGLPSPFFGFYFLLPVCRKQQQLYIAKYRITLTLRFSFSVLLLSATSPTAGVPNSSGGNSLANCRANMWTTLCQEFKYCKWWAVLYWCSAFFNNHQTEKSSINFAFVASSVDVTKVGFEQA